MAESSRQQRLAAVAENGKGPWCLRRRCGSDTACRYPGSRQYLLLINWWWGWRVLGCKQTPQLKVPLLNIPGVEAMVGQVKRWQHTKYGGPGGGGAGILPGLRLGCGRTGGFFQNLNDRVRTEEERASISFIIDQKPS